MVKIPWSDLTLEEILFWHRQALEDDAPGQDGPVMEVEEEEVVGEDKGAVP